MLLPMILLLDSFHVGTSFQSNIYFIDRWSASTIIDSRCDTRIQVASNSNDSTTTTTTTGEEDTKVPKRTTTTPTPSITFVPGPSIETKPDYDNIHGPLGETLDKVFLKLFRSKLAENIGIDSKLPKDDYQGIMELATALNSRYSDRTQVQKIAQNTLRTYNLYEFSERILFVAEKAA